MTYGTLSVEGASICFKVRGRGKALVVLQGGGGTADTSDGIAEVLESEYTVVSYDRRGLLRSALDDPKQTLSVEQHAQDALCLLDELGIAEASFFGTSLGALMGLELMARAPGRVKLLVAHEPLALGLLSDAGRARLRALRAQVLAITLREGARAGLRRALADMGVDRDDREDDAEPPASSREQSRDTGFLLNREVRAIDGFRPDLELLTRARSRIVPAFGVSSRAFYPAECAFALAACLGRPAVEFPGAHNGYVLRPRAFAEKLGAVLRAELAEASASAMLGSVAVDMAQARYLH
jgi:pimeloyl-ACP methyl ester carboxylesterase